MTPAERQQRRRARLRREKKAAERAAKQAEKQLQYVRHREQQAPILAPTRTEWASVPAQRQQANPADELARQVLDALKVEGIALEAFQAALFRRAGATTRSV